MLYFWHFDLVGMEQVLRKAILFVNQVLQTSKRCWDTMLRGWRRKGHVLVDKNTESSRMVPRRLGS